METKKINADEDFRVKTLSIGVVIPDKMIELAREDLDMYVFYPHTVYKAYGIHLDEMNISEMYDELVDNPAVRKDKIEPRKLLEKLATMRYESGYPYIMFQDNVNRVHANNNVARVKFSNLCSEILQYSVVSEYTDYGQEDNIGLDISCNLGSINIANVMDNKNIERAVKLAVDSLTFVSDNTYIKNAPAVAQANELSHSIGLGAMNLHGYLAKNRIMYQSALGREFADTFFMMMNFYSLQRSMEIAKERGQVYYGFEGSTYADGTYFNKYIEQSFAPISDRVKSLFEGIYVPTQEDWQKLKEKVAKYGVYHA